MTLSNQIRELAGKLKSDCPNAPYLPMPVQHLPTILAALELAERLEAPGCVEEVAEATKAEFMKTQRRRMVQVWSDVAQAAISAMKGERG